MIHDIQLFHCNEYEEVVEIESYTEQNGAIISLKKTVDGHNQAFQTIRRLLEQDGWEVELAGVTLLGPNHVSANSYVARHLRE